MRVSIAAGVNVVGGWLNNSSWMVAGVCLWRARKEDEDFGVGMAMAGCLAGGRYGVGEGGGSCTTIGNGGSGIDVGASVGRRG